MVLAKAMSIAIEKTHGMKYAYGAGAEIIHCKSGVDQSFVYIIKIINSILYLSASDGKRYGLSFYLTEEIVRLKVKCN